MTSSLVQFVVTLLYMAGLVALVAVLNVLAAAVYLWVDARFRGGRIGGGACPQAPPRSDHIHAPLVPYDREWWLR